MSEHRFFVPPENLTQSKTLIVGEDVKHIKNVLRLKAGDDVIVCDGLGLECQATLEDINRDFVSARILKCEKKEIFSPEVVLFQAIPKAQKMDFIIQKTTELGVSEIYPLFTERTVTHFGGEKAKEKAHRWKKIALEAAKQSQRITVPKVYEPLLLEESLKFLKLCDLILVFWEEESKNTLKDQIKNTSFKKVGVVIGPEGGLSEKEVGFLTEVGGKTATLGERVLRTETASLVALALVFYEIGALG